SKPKRRKPRMLDRVIASNKTLRERVLASAETQTRKTTYDNYPAPMKLLEVLRTGYSHGEAAGFEAERRGLVELTETDATKNLMRLFFLRQASKKWAGEELHGAAPADVKHVAVIGGGTMGAGIVHVLVRAGYPVRLIEVDANALAAGLGRIQKLLEEDV